MNHFLIEETIGIVGFRQDVWIFELGRGTKIIRR